MENHKKSIEVPMDVFERLCAKERSFDKLREDFNELARQIEELATFAESPLS
jgi:hypothetical protein